MTAQFEAGPKKGTVILFLDFCFKLSQLLVAAISQFIINHPGAHHPSVCMWCNVSQTQMAFSLGEYLAQGRERAAQVILAIIITTPHPIPPKGCSIKLRHCHIRWM